MPMEIPSLAERAKYLKISALTVAEGMRTGTFRSFFRGHGIEFDTVRDYEQGDDIRSIDWNVTARTGRAFVKTWREERELTVFLVIDNSHSMDTGGGKISKRMCAFEAAVLLAFAAEQNASPVGAAIFDGIFRKALKPRAGRDQVLSILKTLEHAESPVPGSVLGNALSGASRLLRSRSLVIVLSDFRAAGYEKPLGILARKHDVLAVRVVSPSDFILPRAGYIPFRDPESGWAASFPTSSAAFRTRWESEAREAVSRWETLCLRRGVSPLVLSADDDPVRVFSAFFSPGRDSGSTVNPYGVRL